jgi:hypothetical protein
VNLLTIREIGEGLRTTYAFTEHGAALSTAQRSPPAVQMILESRGSLLQPYKLHVVRSHSINNRPE